MPSLQNDTVILHSAGCTFGSAFKCNLSHLSGLGKTAGNVIMVCNSCHSHPREVTIRLRCFRVPRGDFLLAIKTKDLGVLFHL